MKNFTNIPFKHNYFLCIKIKLLNSSIVFIIQTIQHNEKQYYITNKYINMLYNKEN